MGQFVREEGSCNALFVTDGPFPESKEFLAGPSLQWRPLPQMHLDVAPLFGLSPDAPRLKLFVVLGYEF